MTSRRRFIRTAAPAMAALGLAPKAASMAFGAPGFAPPVAVFSKVYQELKLDFEQSAEVTAEAGLDGIDCTVRDGGEIVPEQAADKMPRYAEALRRHGTRMLLLTTGIVGVSSPHASEILRTGKQLAIQYYRLGYWSHRPERPPAKLLAEIGPSLKDLAAMNKELGVCGVYQNHSAPQNHSRRNAGCDLAELYDMVKDLDPGQVGVAFDLGHALIEHGDQWREHFDRLKPHIRVVYVKDVQRASGFVPFGQGEFARTGFFDLLARMNYRAPLSMHIEFNWAPEGNKTRPLLLQALKESRRVLGQWLVA
jgi:sugar phosphate isomerase/epimerase